MLPIIRQTCLILRPKYTVFAVCSGHIVPEILVFVQMFMDNKFSFQLQRCSHVNLIYTISFWQTHSLYFKNGESLHRSCDEILCFTDFFQRLAVSFQAELAGTASFPLLKNKNLGYPYFLHDCTSMLIYFDISPSLKCTSTVFVFSLLLLLLY